MQNVNRKNGTFQTTKDTLTIEQSIDFVLDNNLFTLEEYEKHTSLKIAALTKEIENLKSSKAEEDVIKQKQKELKVLEIINEAIVKRKEKNKKISELQEIYRKVKSAYEKLEESRVTLFNYIDALETNLLNDLNKQIKKVRELKDIYNQNQKLCFDLEKTASVQMNELTIQGIVITEKNVGPIPKKEYKSYDEVKKIYKDLIIQIEDIKSKIASTDILHDKKKYGELIVELELVIKEVLPNLLENKDDLKKIKKEVLESLEIDYSSYEDDEDKTKGKGGTGTGKTGQGSGSNGSGKSAGDSSSGDSSGDGSSTGTGDSGSGTNGQDGKDDKGKKPPVPNGDDEKIEQAKAEYIHLINSIKKAVEELNSLNDELDLLTINADTNYDKIIACNERVRQQTKLINEYKDKMFEFEYQQYKDNHIMLTILPEIKDIEIPEPQYSSELETFMNNHNEVIKGCYIRLKEIAEIPNYQSNPALKEEIDKLSKVIDSEHQCITRRLIAERRKNKDFDALGYMNSHLVKKEDVIVQIKRNEKEKQENNIDPKEEENSKKELDKLLKGYQQILLELQLQLYLLETKIAPQVNIEKEEKDIRNKIVLEYNKIIEQIENSKMSIETRNYYFEAVDGIRMRVAQTIDEQMVSEREFHSLKAQFQKDYFLLYQMSLELQTMSEVSIETIEYKEKRETFLTNINLLKEKYKELGLEINVDTLTSRVSLQVFSDSKKEQKEKISLRVMTFEREKSLSKRTHTKIDAKKLNFGGKVQSADLTKALIDTVNGTKISVLKESIKVEYTKQMIEGLRDLKVKLEVTATSKDKNAISVTDAKTTKNEKSEYRYIKKPEELEEAKLVFRNIDTNEQLMEYDILNDPEIKEELERRKGHSL